MREITNSRNAKRQSVLFLTFVFGFVIVGWAMARFLPAESAKIGHTILSLFSLFPLLARVLTSIITKDKSAWMLRPRFRSHWRTYLLAAFVPGILIFVGAVVYFLIFPSHLDVSAARLIEVYGRLGIPSNLSHTVGSIVKIGLVGVIVSPFVFPIAIVTFGEESGWRGYLLPRLVQFMDERSAVLLSGALWGLCHAPRIYFGVNYGLNYPGAPYTGMLMMILVCIALSVWLSYVTLRTNSIIPACILHGAINLIGEFPALVSLDETNVLIGPGPTGILGMSGLMLGAIFILTRTRFATALTKLQEENYEVTRHSA